MYCTCTILDHNTAAQGQANTDEPRDDACENYVLSGCLLSEASEAASYTFAPQPADDWRTGLFWW